MQKKWLMTRRNAMKVCFPALAGIGAAIGTQSCNNYLQYQTLDNSNRNFAIKSTKSLKELAVAKGLIYGTAARYDDLISTPEYAKAVAQQCGILVPEWELKWSAGNKTLRPNPNSFDFKAADWMAEFAKKHSLMFRGHTLVWHLSLPSWFEETVNRQNAKQFLTQHIQKVVSHYAGQMHSWDVVNEAIETNDGRSDGLRNTPWLEFLGTDYIDLSFRIAAEADPKALLVYNDYGLDYDTPEDEAKRTAVLKLLQTLKSRGTPIHALGVQAHLDGEQTKFNPQKLRDFLSNVANLGLKILITELDVTDKNLPANIHTRDRIVAGVYEDYLSAALDERAVIAVITWGLSDRYSWLSEFAPRPDKAPIRAMPLDAQMQRKLAWNAIARAFDHAPKR